MNSGVFKKKLQHLTKSFILNRVFRPSLKILMRSNFRINIRLAINTLLVFCTFAIALKLAPISEIYREKNLCINYLKHQVDRDTLIKRLKIVMQTNPSSICDSILKS